MNDDPSRFRELIRQVREGSQDAANELAKEYSSHVRRAIRGRMPGELRPKFDSMDFEQQVWKSFFAEVKSLPDLQDPQQLIRYLAGIARHKINDEGRHLHTQKHDLQREVRLDVSTNITGPHPISRDPTPSAVAVGREQWERLVHGRTPQERRILELKYAGMTNEEIGREVGLNERCVRQVIYDLDEQNNDGGPGLAEGKGRS
jgi:RNA polymerase sigma factor (sigma-70 family)